MNKPYIGVTGFSKREEVEAMLDGFYTEDERLLMVGVLASEKSIYGIPTKWPKRYPERELIAGIFSGDPRALNLVHYASDNQSLLYEHMEVITTRFGGEHCSGFQLNMKWPDMHVLEKYRTKFPDKKIVLQVGSGAMKQMLSDPKRIARRIATYDSLVDYALIDPSGGLGKQMDVQFALNCISWFYDASTKITIGVAGGLGPDTVRDVEEIIDTYYDTSIDAEGKLRDAEDNFSLVSALRYRDAALRMFAD
jgi:hypothetical protein